MKRAKDVLSEKQLTSVFIIVKNNEIVKKTTHDHDNEPEKLKTGFPLQYLNKTIGG